jgi:DNA gyrase subunit B
MAPKKKTDEYNASNLELIEGLALVRKRPHVYIGFTNNVGLHHLIEEIVANSVDEAMAGHCDRIEVTMTEDNWVSVTDNGRGIPVDIHPTSGLSGVEMVLTKIGGGGKFGGEESGYEVSGGLHGMGSAVVNALSKQMKATIWREGSEWSQQYKIGVPDAPIKKGKKASQTGTRIEFLFDDTVFDKGVRYDRHTVEERLRELSHLNPGLEFIFTFHDQKPKVFKSVNGLPDYLKALVGEKDGIQAVHNQAVAIQGTVREEIEVGGRAVNDMTGIDVALLWTTSDNEVPHTFVNSIRTPKGGDHYDGLRSALRKALNDAAEKLGKFRAKDVKFEQADTREGLYLAVAVKVPSPKFESQAKLSLQNPEVTKRVNDYVAEELTKWLVAKENSVAADAIIQRVFEARDRRLAASKAKAAVTQRKGILGSGGLPGKLADCSSKNREETEVFIVEGDSAGGGMKQTRDRATQAILPLRGKIQNAEKSGEATLNSDAIKDILSALGGSVVPIQIDVKKGNKTVKQTRLIVDMDEPRYGKIVMCTDADVDGGHIATLLMTFFFRFAPQIIRDGRLYMAQLPLYRIEHKKNGRMYLFSDEELEKYTKKNEVKLLDGRPDITRFKGLGEMMPEQLEELALNPETRRLHRVVIDDLGEAEDITTLLMGSRVDRRREYIEEHALDVEVDV